MNTLGICRIVAVFMLLLLLTGCWSSHDITNQHYVTTMGIDYDGEVYTIYAQIISFENVARTEGQGGNTNSPTYVGKGIGHSFNTAADDLYASSQIRIDWGHAKAVVVSDQAMQLLGTQIVERIYRFPENRYNTWLYVTKEPIEDILTTNSFYNRTSLFSVLHMPNNSRKQRATLPPVEMFKYLSAINEPDRISYIPCIGFDTTHWRANEKQMKLLEINGGYIETHNGTKKIFTIEQMKGYRWIDPRLTRTMLLVKDEKTSYAVLTFNKSKVKKKPFIQEGNVKFIIKGFYKGSMNEYINEIDYNKMIELAKEQIKSEIMDIYKLGVKEETDIFNLMHSFRMKNPDKWKVMTKNGSKFILDEDSIERIDIKIVIPHNGKYKRQK